MVWATNTAVVVSIALVYYVLGIMILGLAPKKSEGTLHILASGMRGPSLTVGHVVMHLQLGLD